MGTNLDSIVFTFVSNVSDLLKTPIKSHLFWISLCYKRPCNGFLLVLEKSKLAPQTGAGWLRRDGVYRIDWVRLIYLDTLTTIDPAKSTTNFIYRFIYFSFRSSSWLVEGRGGEGRGGEGQQTVLNIYGLNTLHVDEAVLMSLQENMLY